MDCAARAGLDPAVVAASMDRATAAGRRIKEAGVECHRQGMPLYAEVRSECARLGTSGIEGMSPRVRIWLARGGPRPWILGIGLVAVLLIVRFHLTAENYPAAPADAVAIREPERRPPSGPPDPKWPAVAGNAPELPHDQNSVHRDSSSPGSVAEGFMKSPPCTTKSCWVGRGVRHMHREKERAWLSRPPERLPGGHPRAERRCYDHPVKLCVLKGMCFDQPLAQVGKDLDVTMTDLGFLVLVGYGDFATVHSASQNLQSKLADATLLRLAEEKEDSHSFKEVEWLNGTTYFAGRKTFHPQHFMEVLAPAAGFHPYTQEHGAKDDKAGPGLPDIERIVYQTRGKVPHWSAEYLELVASFLKVEASSAYTVASQGRRKGVVRCMEHVVFAEGGAMDQHSGAVANPELSETNCGNYSANTNPICSGCGHWFPSHESATMFRDFALPELGVDLPPVPSPWKPVATIANGHGRARILASSIRQMSRDLTDLGFEASPRQRLALAVLPVA